MHIFYKTANLIALAVLFCVTFPLNAQNTENEREKNVQKNRDKTKIITLKSKKNKYLDIPTSSYFLTGKNDLVEIDPFNPSFLAPVVTFNFSPLNNGSAFFTFQVPDYVKKKDVISLDLVFLTQSAAEPIEGRVAFQAHFKVLKKDESINANFESHEFDNPWIFKVRSAKSDKIAKSFRVALVGNKAKFHPGDTVIVTLTRIYRIPENYPDSISLLSTRVTTNEIVTENEPLGATPGPTFHCNCHVFCPSPACLAYKCTGTRCRKTKYKIFTKCGCN